MGDYIGDYYTGMKRDIVSSDHGCHEHVTAALQHGLVAQRMLADLHLPTLRNIQTE